MGTPGEYGPAQPIRSHRRSHLDNVYRRVFGGFVIRLLPAASRARTGEWYRHLIWVGELDADGLRPDW